MEMSVCVLCEEQVTQPLCPDCLSRGVEQWLYEKRPELVAELKDRTGEIAYPGGDVCMRCKDSMSICSFCYTKHINSWLMKVDKKLARQHNQIFSLNLVRQ
jgi:hypothetical protein